MLIVLLGPISGAHFNPMVTLAIRLRGEAMPAPWPTYLLAQSLGAILGVWLAHAMFELPLWQPGTRVRTGFAQHVSEAVATFGLLLTILLGARFRPAALPALVAGWIFAAYGFTASTSFANPAVTLARALTQSFAGIRMVDVPGFVVAQGAGTALALLAARFLLAPLPGSLHGQSEDAPLGQLPVQSSDLR